MSDAPVCPHCEDGYLDADGCCDCCAWPDLPEPDYEAMAREASFLTPACEP